MALPLKTLSRKQPGGLFAWHCAKVEQKQQNAKARAYRASIDVFKYISQKKIQVIFSDMQVHSGHQAPCLEMTQGDGVCQQITKFIPRHL